MSSLETKVKPYYKIKENDLMPIISFYEYDERCYLHQPCKGFINKLKHALHTVPRGLLLISYDFSMISFCFTKQAITAYYLHQNYLDQVIDLFQKIS